MANGKPGDNPLTDLAAYGKHPFPPDMERKILKLFSLRADLTPIQFDVFYWEAGQKLEEGRAKLDELLRKLGVDPRRLDEG